MLVTHRRIFYSFMLALLVGVLLPVATPQTAYAQDVETGYLWSLEFDFDSSFNAVLTIEVGPWQDGDLVEVQETSQEIVYCKKIGPVKLEGGDAVFKGNSYLRCTMNLAETVMNNHGLLIEPYDNYGSILMSADLNGSAHGIAPIFTHADASYYVEFKPTQMVTLGGKVSTWENGTPTGMVGQQAEFFGSINAWSTYEMEYLCGANGGPCDARLDVSGQQALFFNLGGRPTFNTGETTFLIGTDGINYYNGRMGNLLVDPGNSAH